MMRFEVASACQYDCAMCAHGGMRLRAPRYQLSLDQLERFIEATRQSDYFIEDLRMHGPGEPLLWDHLEHALPRLKASGVIGRIFIATNGLLVHKLSEASWEHIDEMRISLYDGFTRQDEVRAVMARHGDKIILNECDDFLELPADLAHAAPVPCHCRCDGPMLYGDRMYLYCGPPVFSAMDLMGMDDDAALWTAVAPGYMDAVVPGRLGNLAQCAHCWGNSSFDTWVPQSTQGGGWK
ncbi:MAG: hypothetical protein BGO92_17335 [Magnetospirillum sp. 64-120]|nr:MAG: hypothetical protein BGO92_17335 [Magnetospirillum sp. 64-120]